MALKEIIVATQTDLRATPVTRSRLLQPTRVKWKVCEAKPKSASFP
jgi:hypothetical protein